MNRRVYPLRMGQLPAPNSNSNRAGVGFVLYFILAVVHLPIIVIDQKAIGVYDVVLAVLAIAGAWLTINSRDRVPVDFKRTGLAFAIFLVYSGITILINSQREIVTLIQKESFNFTTALYIKQFQYAAEMIVAVWLCRHVQRSHLYAAVCISILLIATNGFYHVFVTQNWYRIGLIGMEGEASSNPGGFSLAILLCGCLRLLMGAGTFTRNIPGFFVFSYGFLALMFTYSRTNLVAFLAGAAFLSLKFLSFRRLVLIALVAIVVIFADSYRSQVSETSSVGESYKTSVVSQIKDPRILLTDGSFLIRVYEVWGSIWMDWSESPTSVVIGLGFGKVRLVDGFYTNVLFSLGVLGVLVYGWFIITLARFKANMCRCLLIIVLINGVATETIINSFRCVQILIPLFVAFAFWERAEERKATVDRRTHNLNVRRYAVPNPV